jgi:hypothetical protein
MSPIQPVVVGKHHRGDGRRTGRVGDDPQGWRTTMSRHRFAPSARWSCPICLLSTEPAFGRSAEQETALLADVHDRLHHGGSRTAQVLLGDLPAGRHAIAS